MPQMHCCPCLVSASKWTQPQISGNSGDGPPSINPHSLHRFFLASLKSAMIKGCREPPYPSILTDATMEKLALAKFVAQESKCEVRN